MTPMPESSASWMLPSPFSVAQVECSNSYCNDNGEATGFDPNCQCSCNEGFSGQRCEQELRVKVTQRYTGVSEDAFRSKEANYVCAFASVAGVECSAVRIVSITEFNG